MPAENAPFSILGADVEITGDVNAGSDLHIEGTVRGDISCKVLVVAEGGRVIGNVTAEEARIAGTVEGVIDAGRLSIAASARTSGDVAYDRLSIEAGAKTEGRFSHRDTRPAGGAEPKALPQAAA